MSIYKKLFQQTFIYGIATVLPRMLSFFLVGLHTNSMPKEAYGSITLLLSWMIFLNVVLSYGMETAFFRFYNKEEDKKTVVSTSLYALLVSSLSFLFLGILFQDALAKVFNSEVEFVVFAVWILVLDALVVIPFSKLRVEQRPIKYAVIKIANVVINMGLNVFFLVYLPKLAQTGSDSFWYSIYIPNFQIGYIFLSNVVASAFTLLFFIGDYFTLKLSFNYQLLKQMLNYGFPILIAGLAFAVNEHFDKILLDHWLPQNIAKAAVGAYAACYKIGLFMVLFRTAYTLGIEPFFFSYAKNEDAPKTYAAITKYFVIFGSLILLGVVVFADVVKILLVRDTSYWEAMSVVPLILLANFFLGIYTSLSVWYKLIDKTIVGAYISIVGAVLTLVLNYLLIPHFSYLGSAIATLVAYGSMMMISYLLGQKFYAIPYPKKEIGMYLGGSIILSCLYFYIPFFRAHIAVGILFILLFIGFIYRNEKELILKILKR